MLKRQRPATPPPPSLNDPPSFLPNGPIRPLQPSHTADPPQPSSKRQRTQPPPLVGALRGWLEPGPVGPRWESDGEEDFTEDLHDMLGSPLLPSTTANQYKDANSLLHELHVLGQHRLLFVHPPRDRHLSSGPGVSLHACIQDPPADQEQTAWTNGPPCQPTSPRPVHDEVTGRNYCAKPVGERELAEEVQCVRQRYEDVNRLLGSLFLSRRRDVEGTSAVLNPSS